MKTADVVIIGKGPAGISCALYTHRAGFRTVVVGKDLGALAGAEKIENYYGLSSPPSGTELVLAGVEQARRLGIEVADDEVLSVEAGDGFTVSAVRESYSARAVLLATGKKRGAPKIKGLDRFTGRGVSYCAVCDGFFYRGKRLALLGNSRYALHEYEELSHFTREITLCTGGREPEGAFPPSLPIRREKLLALEGDERARRLVFESGGDLEIDGVFVAEGTASAADFAAKIGVAAENGSVLADENGRTNLPGLFAAGDCTGGFLQVASAVSGGARAAQGIIAYLRGKTAP